MFWITSKNSFLVPENLPNFNLLSILENKNSKKFFYISEEEKKKKTIKFSNSFRNFYNLIHQSKVDEIEEQFEDEKESIVIFTEKYKSDYFINYFNIRFGNNKINQSYLHHQKNIPHSVICSEICPENYKKKFLFGNSLAIGTENREIQIWQNEMVDLDEPLLILKSFKTQNKKNSPRPFDLLLEKNEIISLSWNKIQVNFLLSILQKGLINCWDIESGKISRTIQKYPILEASMIEWKPNNKFEFFFLSENSLVHFLDLRIKNEFKKFKSYKQIHSVKGLNHDHFILLIEKKGFINILDLRKNIKEKKNISTLRFRSTLHKIKLSTLSVDKTKLLLVGEEGKFETWNLTEPSMPQKNLTGILEKNIREVGWAPFENNLNLIVVLDKKNSVSLISLIK